MLRSLLFVPAKEKMLNKIGSLDADAYVIDLEDSIEDEMKPKALDLVLNYLEHTNIQSPIFVRINKGSFRYEVECLVKFLNVGFMLPKFEDVDFYSECSEFFMKHPVIALIETPLGIVNVADVAKCPWVDSIAFGAEDFTSSVSMKNENALLRYQKSCLVTYAKAYKKQVYDTPSFYLGLCEPFEMDVKDSVDLGFDGKLVINPGHISYVNESFNIVHYEEIKKIVEQYERTGKAVQVIDGKVYEKMHIEDLKGALIRNQLNKY